MKAYRIIHKISGGFAVLLACTLLIGLAELYDHSEPVPLP